ncbi:hypothetical protein WA158_000684 [Blastocystis sp. Blastoise]
MSDTDEITETENPVTRQMKRKQNKKNRKKLQRQLKQQLLEKEEEENENEPEIKEIIDICQECSSHPCVFHCKDCKKYYCKDCCERIHQKLQSEKVFHTQITLKSSVETYDEYIKKHPEQKSNEDNPVFEKIMNQYFDKEEEVKKNDEEIIQKKQHEGLRCTKCFLLLCPENDFLYGNGSIWTDPSVLNKHHFDNIYHKGRSVYCKNIHCIGRVEMSTYANKPHMLYRLFMEKTTFKDNYLNNPKYKGTKTIENRILGRYRPIMPSEEESISGNCDHGW